LGKFGDCGSVGKGVNEIKIDYDPGSRVYFGRSDFTVVILLCGGTKKECDYERSGTRFVSLNPDNFSHSSNLTAPKTWAADEPAKWNIAGNPELIWTKKCF
jgi:hypothetical protein